MKTKVFTGNECRKMLPIIGDDKARVITPIADSMVTGKSLGHLIVYKGYAIDAKGEKIYSRPLTSNQINSGILGSFMFIGTDAEFFHHLINPNFTGKFSESDLLIDRHYDGMISYQFVIILKNYIAKYKDV